MAKKNQQQQPKQIKRKSAQQQLWRLQKKIEQPRIPLERKRELESKIEDVKNFLGYEGLTKREETRYKKEKRSLSVKRSKLKKQFLSKDISSKERNALRRELFEVSNRFNEINKKIGTFEQPEKVEKGVSIDEKAVTTYTVPVWEVKPNHLDPALSTDEIKAVYIEGEKFKRPQQDDEIYDAWFSLEASLLALGSFAMVQIVKDLQSAELSIDSIE